MAPKKLTEAEKQDIVSLYRDPAETTTTLSERFGVSSSTISRILKGALSKEEYDVLVQQKRAKGPSAAVDDVPDDVPDDGLSDSTSRPTSPVSSGKTDSGKPMPITKSAKSSRAAAVEPTAVEPTATDSAVVAPSAAESAPDLAVSDLASVEAAGDIAPAIADQSSQADSEEDASRRSRKRSSAKPVTKSDKIRAQAEQAVVEKIGQQLHLLDASFREDTPMAGSEVVTEAVDVPTLETPQSYTANNLDEEEDDDFDDELDDDDLDDIDDLDDDFDEDDDDDDDYGQNLLNPTSASDRILIEILPFEDAELPRTCYLVVDRFAELITRPLREFGHLGQIPEAEVQEMTLPVFDNHRVARRFSRRNQRVIKVPDGTMLEKTSDYLQAKGITRLLIDGQIYALD